VRLALARAELAWAEADAQRALALLPAAEAAGMNAEMRLGELALRVQAQSLAGALEPGTVAAARAALCAEPLHAVAALRLHRALAAASRAGVAGVPGGAAPECAEHVQRLAASLSAHPTQRAAFLRAWG